MCLAKPCGTIDLSQKNLTINIAFLTLEQEISNVAIIIDGMNIPIDVSGIDVENFEYSSCWTTIPSNNITSVNFNSNETEYEINVNGSSASNASVLTIAEDFGQFVADLSKYEECNDNPTN